ncbi:MAG: methyltransferase domain-containing protein [Phycisphaeraceae bacterium]|nr:MAG: methyltransferase domain-containing protein [Phycisphaeraceae bacterium]
MPATHDEATKIARDYYNSTDADNFYFHIWGGEDIHVGMYRTDDEPIADASRRTVEYMADRAGTIDSATRVLDIGAGYGGAARWLARRFGCHVTALNLSEAENERDRAMNEKHGLEEQIDVVDGAFEDLPFGDAMFEVVWSQDAILHSGDRARVLDEVDRVLKPSGKFVFTDPMRTDSADVAKLRPILDRIHLPDLGTPGFYREQAKRRGWRDLGFDEQANRIPQHYSRVLAELDELEPELEGLVSGEYIERMKSGLRHWIDGGEAGLLTWGVFAFRKPEAR